MEPSSTCSRPGEGSNLSHPAEVRLLHHRVGVETEAPAQPVEGRRRPVRRLPERDVGTGRPGMRPVEGARGGVGHEAPGATTSRPDRCQRSPS